jgi:hypothetical protein
MVEQAKYEVLKKINNVEIRRYPTLVIARVDGYGDGGFNLLFNFITGNNRQKSKIEMTAPVVSEQIAMTAPVLSESDSIGFVMPEGLTIETTSFKNSLKLFFFHTFLFIFSDTSSIHYNIKEFQL